jgi:hypothetical protein
MSLTPEEKSLLTTLRATSAEFQERHEGVEQRTYTLAEVFCKVDMFVELFRQLPVVHPEMTERDIAEMIAVALKLRNLEAGTNIIHKVLWGKGGQDSQNSVSGSLQGSLFTDSGVGGSNQW